MIKEIYGDLLDFPKGIDVIAHSCNCQNVMGGGVAKQIRDRYPAAWRADCDAADAKTNILGTFSHAYVSDIHKREPARYVYNMYTQQHLGHTRRHVNYDAFYTAFKAFYEETKERQYASDRKIIVGVPYLISCKLAGGSWKVIRAILEDIFETNTKSPLDLMIVRNLEYDPL